jgi:hypothetical protein
VLKDLTIEVTFCRNGRPLFTTSTWAGYVGKDVQSYPLTLFLSFSLLLSLSHFMSFNFPGCLTGMKPGTFPHDTHTPSLSFPILTCYLLTSSVQIVSQSP